MIHRDGHKTDFTRIANSALRDDRLSLEARGLLSFMLTMSDQWEFSIKGLAYQHGVGEKTIMRLVKELKAAGYIIQERHKDKKGVIDSCTWHIYESSTLPSTHSVDSPQCGKPTVWVTHSDGDPQCGKREVIRTINTKELSIVKNEQKIKKDDFGKFLDPLPSDLKATFEEFITMRKTIKAPMTPHALDLAIRKAYQLGDNDPQKAKAVVEQSIMNSWKGLFPLKEKAKTEPISENPFTRLRREEGYES